MSITFKPYCMVRDFERVSNFLRDNFQGYPENGVCEQPFWEKIHGSHFLAFLRTHKFGIWEDDGEIIGIVFFDEDVGEVFLNAKTGYGYIKHEHMLPYAEQNLYGTEGKNSAKYLSVYCGEYEKELQKHLIRNGYMLKEEMDNLVYSYDRGFPEVYLPEGFQMLISSNEADWRKLADVMHRVFENEYPDDDTGGMGLWFSMPNCKYDLATIIIAPNGDYAAYAQLWVDEINQYAYLEPLLTDYKYQGQGLATIALTESMRRSRKYNARFCVGADSPFYRKYGFQKLGGFQRWERFWDNP